MLHIPFIDRFTGHHEVAHREAATPEEALLDGLVTIAGRILFSAIFLVGGVEHLVRYDAMVEYATANGVGGAWLLVPLTGMMIILGGLSVLLGYATRMGAWLLFLFLVPTAVLMHRFWGLDNPALASVQMAHFMKNMALAGASLLLTRFGSGPWSIDKD